VVVVVVVVVLNKDVVATRDGPGLLSIETPLEVVVFKALKREATAATAREEGIQQTTGCVFVFTFQYGCSGGGSSMMSLFRQPLNIIGVLIYIHDASDVA
jgi:hypothetical protein